MNISDAERIAIQEVLAYAEALGYGNLISHLQTAWAKRLMRGGLPEKTARLAAGGLGMPFKMQEDLIERGMWDETGASYRTAPNRKRTRKRRAPEEACVVTSGLPSRAPSR